MASPKSNTLKSAVHAEIGVRLSQGRKALGRPEIKTPAGVSMNIKRKALERAKALVIDRHFDEVRKICAEEIEFLVGLYEWAGKPEDFSAEAISKLSERYFEATKVERVELVEDDAIIDTEGRELFYGKPRPQKKLSSNTDKIFE